jgi:Fe2+ or Zn2+ uptake regulation protein
MQDTFTQVLQAFKQNGGRITEQRKNLISLILSHPGLSSKELCYLAHSADISIGRATVYRTVQNLQDLGFIKLQSVIIQTK